MSLGNIVVKGVTHLDRPTEFLGPCSRSWARFSPARWGPVKRRARRHTFTDGRNTGWLQFPLCEVGSCGFHLSPGCPGEDLHGGVVILEDLALGCLAHYLCKTGCI